MSKTLNQFDSLGSAPLGTDEIYLTRSGTDYKVTIDNLAAAVNSGVDLTNYVLKDSPQTITAIHTYTALPQFGGSSFATQSYASNLVSSALGSYGLDDAYAVSNSIPVTNANGTFLLDSNGVTGATNVFAVSESAGDVFTLNKQGGLLFNNPNGETVSLSLSSQGTPKLFVTSSNTETLFRREAAGALRVETVNGDLRLSANGAGNNVDLTTTGGGIATYNNNEIATVNQIPSGVGLQVQTLVNGLSFDAEQNPTGLGFANAAQINFGSPQTTVDVTIQADGSLVFNTTGQRIIEAKFQFGRSTTTGVTNLFGFATQELPSGGGEQLLPDPIGAKIDNDNLVIPFTPYQQTFNITEAGTIIRYYIARENQNDGGLRTIPSTESYGDAPCAEIFVKKFVGDLVVAPTSATEQSTYDNSGQPQKVINNVKGALQYKAGNGNDTFSIFEILNNAGDIKTRFFGNGNISVNSLTNGSKIDVDAGTGDGIRLRNGADERALLWNSAGDNAYLVLKNSSGTTNAYINTGGNSWINGGDLGVGTELPIHKQDIRSTSPELLGLYRDLDVGTVGAAGIFFDMGARVGATPTPSARLETALAANGLDGSLFLRTKKNGVWSANITVLDNDNMGFGNSNPENNFVFGADPSYQSGGKITVRSESGENKPAMLVEGGSATGDPALIVRGRGTTVQGDLLKLSTLDDAGFNFLNFYSGEATDGTGGTSQFRVSSSGEVVANQLSLLNSSLVNLSPDQVNGGLNITTTNPTWLTLNGNRVLTTNDSVGGTKAIAELRRATQVAIAQTQTSPSVWQTAADGASGLYQTDFKNDAARVSATAIGRQLNFLSTVTGYFEVSLTYDTDASVTEHDFGISYGSTLDPLENNRMTFVPANAFQKHSVTFVTEVQTVSASTDCYLRFRTIGSAANINFYRLRVRFIEV